MRLTSCAVAPWTKLGAISPAAPPSRSRLATRQEGWLPPGGGLGEPWAGHLGRLDACGLLLVFGPAIDDVFAVNLVRAKHQRLELVREALRRLLDRRHRIQPEVKRGHALGVEPPAMDGRAFAGERLERPSGIVGPVSQADKLQAKPPSAIELR